jgi:hypothetical protein
MFFGSSNKQNAPKGALRKYVDQDGLPARASIIPAY